MLNNSSRKTGYLDWLKTKYGLSNIHFYARRDFVLTFSRFVTFVDSSALSQFKGTNKLTHAAEIVSVSFLCMHHHYTADFCFGR